MLVGTPHTPSPARRNECHSPCAPFVCAHAPRPSLFPSLPPQLNLHPELLDADGALHPEVAQSHPELAKAMARQEEAKKGEEEAGAAAQGALLPQMQEKAQQETAQQQLEQ